MQSQPEYHAWKKRFVMERHHEPTPYDAWVASRTPSPAASSSDAEAPQQAVSEPAKKQCALCWETARIGSICDSCHGSMGTKPGAPPHQAVKTDAAPMFYASPEQANALQDRPDDYEGGVYLPLRKTSAGKFTMPLYAAPAVDAGWKLVPVEPTAEMIEAAMQVKRERLKEALMQIRAGMDETEARAPVVKGEWDAMLAAAPTPASGETA